MRKGENWMDGQTVIYLVRHGECEGNTDNRLRGRVDFPLNDIGKKQIIAAADFLSSRKLDIVYSAPLKRALETAEMIARPHALPVTVSEDFNNMRLGVWENRNKDELKKEFPREWKLWLTNPEALNIEGAETVDNVRERAFRALNAIVESHCGAHIAIISHRGVLKPMIAAALGIATPYMWRIHLDNASITCLVHTTERGYTLLMSNSVEHLKGIPFVREFN